MTDDQKLLSEFESFLWTGWKCSKCGTWQHESLVSHREGRGLVKEKEEISEVLAWNVALSLLAVQCLKTHSPGEITVSICYV